MRTFEEVEFHLLTNGYKSSEIDKICGYLIGAGVKEPDYELPILIGVGTFEEFYAWFNDAEDEDDCDASCDCPNCILCGLMRDIAERMTNAENDTQKEYFANQLQFLVEKFCLDELGELSGE